MIPTLSEDERVQLLQTLGHEDAVERHRRSLPTDWYRPHTDGQRQFHQSSHIVRCLFPGNGFGKTRAAGTELHWWATHSHPFQRTPSWPIIAVWCCETFKQFKLLRTQLEGDCLGNKPRFNKVDNVYTWPDGGMMFLVSGDSSWTHVQGINPDLVIFDEEPPEALWNEMKMRRRGLRKTRYVFAATATQGMTWMHRDLYTPWLEHHNQQGCDEFAATDVQSHPRLWVWPRGGIDNNPGADAGDRDWYRSQTFNSDAERSVRLGGGFADFSGTPVFDLVALEAQKHGLLDGESGMFSPVPASHHKDPRAIVRNVGGKVTRVRLAWNAGAHTPQGRINVYAKPIAGRLYVIGHDSSYGLAGGDFDAAVVLDRETGEQVADALGHWGDVLWAEVLFGLGWHYNLAFMLGERQYGLPVMRRLYDEHGYTFQYYRRDDKKRGRTTSDELGHWKFTGDPTLGNLRRAIAPRGLGGKRLASEVTLRGKELHRQCVKFQFRPKSETREIHEVHDEGLIMSAPRGDHDDLVLALAYARKAMDEAPRFEQPEYEYPEGSAGEVLGMKDDFNPPKKTHDPFARES